MPTGRSAGRSAAWQTRLTAALTPGPRRERTGTIDHHRGPSAGPTATEAGLSLTLHIGMGKTGTTSLQAFLDRNRARLADAGWLYPRSIGRTRHAQFGLWIRPDDEVENAVRDRRPGTRPYRDAAHLRREVPRRLLQEVGRTGLRKVLVSDEALYASSEPALERLRQFADDHASEVRVVCYLRRQDDLLVSHYQQVVKVRATRTLSARVEERDLSPTYDFHERLRTWLRIVEPDELVIRRFEPGRFRNGSLYDDFVDAAGLGIPTDDLPPRHRNESLDAESVELLRLLNLFRREHGSEGLPDNRALVPVLAESGRGPTLTLPEPELDRFMAQWADSNAAVARELLGEPEGLLFSTPRKDDSTTTRQRLDPARLDHYLRLLELPEQVHAPFRALVEREARTA